MRARTPGLLILSCTGCAAWQSPMAPAARIHHPESGPALAHTPPAPPGLPDAPRLKETPKPPPAALDPKKPQRDLPIDSGPIVPPFAPSVAPDGPLKLSEVLSGTSRAFPLLLALEQQRAITSGQRLSAEGAFDLQMRARGTNTEGSFQNSRLDVGVEQAVPFWGMTSFAGYRFGYGTYPVYYGDRKTADGGELRAGFTVPLLRDGPIDRRRAALRQAQIVENLADPVIRRARLDFLTAAVRAYYAWIAAGERYAVAAALLKLANDRQVGFEEQFRRGAIAEFIPIQNSAQIRAREGELAAARRRLEEAGFNLGLYVRDNNGDPITPTSERLPRDFLQQQPTPGDPNKVAADILTALANRPELERFRLLKDRAAVDLQLAKNATFANLDAGLSLTQDVGYSKPSSNPDPIFGSSRQSAEMFLSYSRPAQLREARGRVITAQAQIAELLATERFERDRISAQVQDAVSNVERSLQRLVAARSEAEITTRVAVLERERFRDGASDLLAVNLQEIAAAAAATKVIDALTDYYRALAEYRVALGLDPE
jgi:outer membrane protein, heavy metal efflux system